MLRLLPYFLLVGLFFFSCKTAREKTQPLLEPISESVYASGIITSRDQYKVFSTVGGLVQAILVKEGDVVKQGDPLFVVKNETSKLNAENAKIATELADYNLRGERLQELKDAIQTTKSVMQNDSLLVARLRRLYADGAETKVNVERQELALQTSTNNHKAAISRYNDLKKQLAFAAAQSKKQLSISQNIAQDYTVRSQQAGRIYSISIEPGETVNLQTPVAIIGAADAFLTELQVDENDIVRIKKGQQVLLTMDSYKGKVFGATVSKIDLLMNERTRTFTVEAEFTEAPPVLYPNLTAEANIVIQAKEKALTIPRAYLVGDTAVVLENEETRRVVTGLMDYQKAEILSGLTANEFILKPTQ